MAPGRAAIEEPRCLVLDIAQLRLSRRSQPASLRLSAAPGLEGSAAADLPGRVVAVRLTGVNGPHRLRVDQRVRLATTVAFGRGSRPWLACPGLGGGRACGRRARKLFLPPGAAGFACPACHGLTASRASANVLRSGAGSVLGLVLRWRAPA